MNKEIEQKRADEAFCKLLRLSLGLTQETPVVVNTEMWKRLYQTAVRQSLIGVCYQGACLMSDCKPPMEILLKWASEAESIRGMNELQYQEAARLTREFAEKGRKTAILKGQANARLYPDKYARQPGDIDIWVEGGRESVLALLPNHLNTSYHHVHLPANEQGVTVEVHFRPSSGSFNPLTNRRLQRWLGREILMASQVEEGFYVPSIKFALVMQLAHIQRHFLAGGIGLRHICDYYWLLYEASADDLLEVEEMLRRFGLRHTAGALMWIMGEVLKLGTEKMICTPDIERGKWMLHEMMTGGNFGRYAERQRHGVLRRFAENRLWRLQLMRFNFSEILWLELNFLKTVLQTLPTRIKYRTLSLRDIPR